MTQQRSSVQNLPADTARAEFDNLVDRVEQQGGRVVIERDGIPVAAIVSTADLDRLTTFEREREERFRILDEVRTAFADIPSEELEREAARAIAEVRADRRARNGHSASEA